MSRLLHFVHTKRELNSRQDTLMAVAWQTNGPCPSDTSAIFLGDIVNHAETIVRLRLSSPLSLVDKARSIPRLAGEMRARMLAKSRAMHHFDEFDSRHRACEREKARISISLIWFYTFLTLRFLLSNSTNCSSQSLVTFILSYVLLFLTQTRARPVSIAIT